ncbi:MAG: hypothetical protein NC314_00800 [Roseburia sp.]|nr:hypothetical protein [Roseburia sp.]MCM1241352.1 hypothetical protein [Roseburia sp.]
MRRLSDSEWEDYISGKKKEQKKGVADLLAAGALILMMSVVVSCGQQSGEGQADTADRESADEKGLSDNVLEEDIPGETEAESTSNFDYNHEYNNMIRVYDGDVYVDREDGIYLVKGGEGEEKLLFANSYSQRRGMELYQHFLFFSGSVEREDAGAATIYRMDLETQKVIDALAVHSQFFEYLHNISIYEDKLYVAEGFGHRLGFALTSDGEIGQRLDEDADGFLYKESNEYVELTMQMINSSNDSDEYQTLVEKEAGMYQPFVDVAACKKLLHGNLVVSRYKDEACREAYLEHEDGTYEYICDISDPYGLVTEGGLYYLDGVSGDILYVDFDSKQPKTIYKQPQEQALICLCTYDEDYIYFMTNKHLGFDEEDKSVHEICLQRVSRQGGDSEKLYQFEEGMEWRTPWNFFGRCGVYGNDMYSEEYETIRFGM